MTAAIEELSKAVEAKEQNRVLQGLKAPILELQGVDDQAAAHYTKELAAVQASLPTSERFNRAQVRKTERSMGLPAVGFAVLCSTCTSTIIGFYTLVCRFKMRLTRPTLKQSKNDKVRGICSSLPLA